MESKSLVKGVIQNGQKEWASLRNRQTLKLVNKKIKEIIGVNWIKQATSR